jgi:hypothetical protein
MPAQLLVCRICGCAPAAKVTFRGHRGLILLMQFLSMSGPFCRDCGLATFRRMTSSTMLQGWWGLASFFITPITILINLVLRYRVANLGPPQRVPGVVGALSPYPLDPGKPVLARPQAIAAFVVLLVLVVLVILSNL